MRSMLPAPSSSMRSHHTPRLGALGGCARVSIAPRFWTVCSATEGEAPSVAKLPRKRRLVLLRHAEAEPRDASNAGELDKGRALTERGRQAASQTAKNLARKPPHWSMPELLLVSDTVRTRETLAVMQTHLSGLSEARTVFVPEFYDSSATGADAMAAIMRALREQATESDATVLCLGHNAGWEECSTALAGEPVALKTAQAALLKSNARSWADVTGPDSVTQWVLMAKLSWGDSAKTASSVKKAESAGPAVELEHSASAIAAKKAKASAAKAAAALKAADESAAAAMMEAAAQGKAKRVKERKASRQDVPAAAPAAVDVTDAQSVGNIAADVTVAEGKKKKQPATKAAKKPVDEPGSGPEDNGGMAVDRSSSKKQSNKAAASSDMHVSTPNGEKRSMKKGGDQSSKAGNAKRKALESALAAQWSLAKATAAASSR